MASLKDEIAAKLAAVAAPDGRPLTATGKLSDIVATDGKVFLSITVDAAQVKIWEHVRRSAENAVRAVPGVQSVMIALTAERAGASRPSPASGGGPGRGKRAATTASARAGRRATRSCGAGTGATAGRARRHSWRRRDHRGRFGQGWRRQIDGCDQSRAGVA